MCLMASSGWNLQDKFNLKSTFCLCLCTALTLVISSVIEDSCFRSIALCLLLAITFIGSLYIWKLDGDSAGKLTRNHEAVILRRFISVSIASVFSIGVVIYHNQLTHQQRSVLDSLGFRLQGSLRAILFPFFLTAVLFSGPILSSVFDGIFVLYFDIRYWIGSIKNALWLRNHVMAPLTEELTFRSCMLPILIPCFGVKGSMLLSPLFFGIGHLHHMMEMLKLGVTLKDAMINSAFQFGYTTIFGIYSSFLFIRTGNFLAPLVAHALCNHMGFPNFAEIFVYRPLYRTLLCITYVAGLVSWYYLLDPLTKPELYSNDVWVQT